MILGAVNLNTDKTVFFNTCDATKTLLKCCLKNLCIKLIVLMYLKCWKQFSKRSLRRQSLGRRFLRNKRNWFESVYTHLYWNTKVAKNWFQLWSYKVSVEWIYCMPKKNLKLELIFLKTCNHSVFSSFLWAMLFKNLFNINESEVETIRILIR